MTDRKSARLARIQQHLEELQAIGYTGGTLRPLRTLELRVHRAAEDYCNGNISETEYSNIEMRVSNAVTSLFGGNEPVGFFVNSDPRGYALKLDDDAYKLDLGRGDMPITYKDWGGYMILAPEF